VGSIRCIDIQRLALQVVASTSNVLERHPSPGRKRQHTTTVAKPHLLARLQLDGQAAIAVWCLRCTTPRGRREEGPSFGCTKYMERGKDIVLELPIPVPSE